MNEEDPTNGVVIGQVCDIVDPEKLGRVKVTFPHLDDQNSNWARMCTPMAGKNRGIYFIPEVGDEVLVVFEQGNVRRPLILGAMWSTVDTPPPTDGDQPKNNWRFIRSRSGHQIILDDTDGKEQIVVVDKDKQRKIVIDSANQKIQVLCDSGDVEVKAPTGKVDVQAQDVSVKATNSVKVEGLTVEIKATTTMTLEAQGSMSIKAATISIEGQASAELKGASVTVQGQAMTTVKGGIVMIN